jgi:polysaccharide pyruvyl transferase WcaK-like protein
VRNDPKIVILGWYGSANTGDEAVLEATVSALRDRGLTRLHVLSTDPEATARRLGVNSSPRRLTLETLRAMREADVLILGGGGLIQDGTSVYNLPIYALFVALTRLFGARVIAWGLGVEPIWTRLGKLLTRAIVGLSSHFSVRDHESLRLLRVAGVPIEKVEVTADPALLIPVPKQPGQSSGKPHVIFCLRDLSDNHPGINLHYLLPVSVRKRLGVGWKLPLERVDGLVEAMGAGVDYCVGTLDADVTLLALWPGRDDAILEHVQSDATRRGVPARRVRIERDLRTPQDVARFVAGADLLVSMRLHAIIFAAGAGVPTLALAYARKMRGEMRALGMERWVVEVESRTPPPEEVTGKLAALWQNRREVSARIERAAERARRRAKRDANDIAAIILGRSSG